MRKLLLFVLLAGLLVVQVTGAKRNRKNKGDTSENMDHVDEMEHSDETGDSVHSGETVTEASHMGEHGDSDMAGKPNRMGEHGDSEMAEKPKNNKKAGGGGSGNCVYSFTVPQTDGQQACTAVDHDMKARIEMLEMKSQQQEAMIQSMQVSVMSQVEQLQQLNSQLAAMGNLMSQATNPANMHAIQGSAMEHNVVYRDCQHIVEESGMEQVNGVYEIQPWKAIRPFKVQCDMQSPDGVWTIIQTRKDGSVNFNMDWISYKVGFGDHNGEYWVGNENIHKLTSQSKYMLHVEFEDWENNHRFAEYDGFRIDNEYSNYKLHVGKYNGTAGDSLSYHDNQEFSTPDMDNDSSEPTHCAQSYISGWWFNNCFHSNLNGFYHQGNDVSQPSSRGGVSWYTLKETNMYSLKAVTMKVKRLGFI